MANHKQCEATVKRELGVLVETLMMKKGKLKKLSKNNFSNVIHVSSHPGQFYSPFDLRFEYMGFPAYGDIKSTQDKMEEKMTTIYYSTLTMSEFQYTIWNDFLKENPNFRLFLIRHHAPNNNALLIDYRQHILRESERDWDGKMKYRIGFKYGAIMEVLENVFTEEERKLINSEKYRQLRRHEKCSEYGCIL